MREISRLARIILHTQPARPRLDGAVWTVANESVITLAEP